MENAVSAPYCTRQLADLGARVIKVERRDGGDMTRQFDTKASGLGAHFTWVNRGKESLSLDVKKPEAQHILAELLARADVFVHNLAPGAAERQGLAGQTLVERHPRLVACEISGYGKTGPYASRRAYDLLIQSETAVVTITGSAEQPIKPGVAVADVGTGNAASAAILAALLCRHNTGRGCVLDISMFDVVADWMGYALTIAKHGGTPEFAPGLSHPSIAPYDAFQTADGQRIVIAIVNDREWRRLAVRILGQPELAEKFSTNTARVENRAVVDAYVREAIGRMTLDNAIDALNEAGIACARVNTVDNVVNHPQLTERGRWASIGSPVGTIPTLLPPGISSTWSAPLNPLPALGEHTDSILRELGRTEAEIRNLHETGTV